MPGRELHFNLKPAGFWSDTLDIFLMVVLGTGQLEWGD
jgi:hypothetical protein